MKSLFLATTFLSIVLTVHAQRAISYTCQLTHKHSQSAFYLTVSETRKVNVGGWKIYARLRRVEDQLEVSLRRVVDIMDATYQKEAKKLYPLNARTLGVELEHAFAGRTDVFNMVCYPRDP